MKVKIKVDKVVSVYSGKARACCCGCSGLHSYASAHPANANRDEFGDASVIRVVRKIERMIAAGVKPDTYGSYIAVETGTRQYIAYFG